MYLNRNHKNDIAQRVSSKWKSSKAVPGFDGRSGPLTSAKSWDEQIVGFTTVRSSRDITYLPYLLVLQELETFFTFVTLKV